MTFLPFVSCLGTSFLSPGWRCLFKLRDWMVIRNKRGSWTIFFRNALFNSSCFLFIDNSMKRAGSPTDGSSNREEKGKQRRLDGKLQIELPSESSTLYFCLRYWLIDPTTISTGTSSTSPSTSTSLQGISLKMSLWSVLTGSSNYTNAFIFFLCHCICCSNICFHIHTG
jgi:hypothetical protein